MDARDPSRRIAHNPFYILGLSPECSRIEIEREGQKLLGMLQVGLSAAKTYTSPLGRHERTSDRVREAMAELRDPEKRLNHELWARLSPAHMPNRLADPTAAASADNRGGDCDTEAGFRGAGARVGWRR